MARKKTARPAWKPGDPLELHPAWRNPDASAEDAEDLQRRCPHPPHRAYAGSYLDLENPSLMTHWVGCCDCGLMVFRDNWRLRKPSKAEIKRDRARVLADLDPFMRELVETKYPLVSR